MVNTRSPSSQSNPSNANPNPSLLANQPPTPQTNPSFDPIAHQLSSIASRLDTIDALATEVAALKAQVPQADTSLDVSDKGKAKDIN